MDPRKSQLAERIRTVQASFITALPRLIIDIDERWKALRHTAWDGRTARELQSHAHRLAGSGGTFGFPDISRAAAALDVTLGETLGESLRSPEDVAPERLLLLEGQVDDLVRVLKAALVSTAAESPEPLLTERIAEAPDRKLVVVIDDDELLRERLAAVLESAGYEVAAFADPPSAIALLQDRTAALVLLDLMFPGQRWPAFEVIADIRGETGVRTPVAVMSGRADFRSRLQATRAGADAYLVKPIDDRQLLESVAQLTARPDDDSWRCLVVDDDELLALQLVDWLREAGMAADWVASPRDSWLKVRDFKPDLLVLDVNMPECSGIELAAMLRQDTATSQLPIVFLTSDATERTRRDAMAAGADDFLLKPVSRDALLDAVVARARLGKRIQDQVGRLTQQSPQGSGLSRHFFFTELERVLDDSGADAVQPALALIGLVAAPQMRETRGAPGLAAVQEQLTERLGQLNLATWALLGENLVGVLLARDTVSGHQTRVEELLARLASGPYRLGEERVDAGASAALLHLRGGQAVAALLVQAEQMLGLALERGKGAIVDGFVGTADTVETTGKLPVNRLRTVYQPIATIGEDSDPVSTVLARITDSDGNLLPAGRFLAALEKRGWLPELDAWVFSRAHQVLTADIDADEPLTLVVHASPRSLNSAIYQETVQALLHERPMRQPRQQLVLAVPESTAITHRQLLDRLNSLLREAGGGLMLTGYGATAQARTTVAQLQPLYVRLDDTLTQRLAQAGAADPADQALLDAASAAKATVVAAGIESASSLSGLWAKGVRWFQGYFIQEPAPVLHAPSEGD